ncbi:MAG: TIGR01906 family membrane protein [Dehalococcoidia bacterium]|nr:TIGR01906 family membrane protein [Dehalococcoidia bacterium]
MLNMNGFSRVLKLLFVICLPLLFVSLSIRIVSTSEWFFERGFDAYGISQTTGLERAELVKAGKALISYFKTGEGSISIQVNKNGKSISLFNDRETAHLVDVKGLFDLNTKIGEAAGLYLIAYVLVLLARPRKGDMQRTASLFFGGSLLAVGLVLLLGIGSVIDFEALFIQFHLLSFNNDLWLLDPAKDYLIMMFPTGFWIDATLGVAALIAAQGLVVGGLSYGFLRRRR